MSFSISLALWRSVFRWHALMSPPGRRATE
jgi:hypothetical protein